MNAANCAPDDLARAIGKAARRLLPFLLLLYVLAFLDRANLGFAKQSFLRDTGLGEAAYAFGAGVFFVGYALFEVPSNLIMRRVGARVWMCRIMVTWGLVSAAMMLAWDKRVFCALRFLLGVAEAGFFPGVILYLTYWFPARERGPMLGLFYFGAPLAFIFGGPLSGGLMELNGTLGLRGWQWLFAVEGLLASVVGVWTYWYLVNRPAEAAWLSAAERGALQQAVDAEEAAKQPHNPPHLLTALARPRLLHFALIYLSIQISVYGVTFYLPAQVERLLGAPAGLAVGLVTAIPWVCALAAAWTLPRVAARLNRRQSIAALTLCAAAAGIAASGSERPALALAALCLAAAGFISAQPVFWTFPTNELAGRAAAGGIALINTFGAVGGFIAPNLRAFAEHSLASPAGGVLSLRPSRWPARC
jgi:sugar phosphate permease